MTKTSNRQSKKAESTEDKKQFVFITKIIVLNDLRKNPLILENDEINKLMDEYIPISTYDKFIFYLKENGIKINDKHIFPLQIFVYH